MKDGYIKTAAITPHITLANPVENAKATLEEIKKYTSKGAKLLVFPELGLTGYTNGDLFLQDRLLNSSYDALKWLIEQTNDVDALIFVGLPYEVSGKVYNVAAAFSQGKLLGLVPKLNLPNYNEFYERRQFTPGENRVYNVKFDGYDVPFGPNLLFHCSNMRNLTVACEICEDLWVPCPPSTMHALAGASIIVNLSASNDIVGKRDYRKMLLKSQSAKLVSGYVYASAGDGESTTDLVYSGHDLIAENGTLLADVQGSAALTEIDVNRLASERRKMTTYPSSSPYPHEVIEFTLKPEETVLTREYPKHPFVPEDKARRNERCEEILGIQAMGLAERMKHIHAKHAVVGISGGLDSTLALLVTARAFDMLKIPRQNILAVTMPAFGTTSRTYNNSVNLIKALDAEFKEVNIKAAVNQHFEDIDHDPEVHDVTYENSQARERTQVLMDLANQSGGIVIGTGDLSELALGWATYNGDHMSMYGVNASIPKTLVRHLVKYVSDTHREDESSILSKTLDDILDTPVSPELLPPKEGEISQKTEDLVGPYELHDFFLYYMMRASFEPSKIYRIALKTFEGEYDKETILKWLKNFYHRFFAQQFKRSCLPDCPKVGSVSLSPRGDWRMPSDANVGIWMADLENLD